MSHPELPDGEAGITAGHVRWAILWLTCGGLFGQFFAFDIPSALNEQMQDDLIKTTGITASQYEYYFGLLYSVYSVPNVILPLALGVAVDRCGCRVLICCLGLCVVLGQFLFATGFEERSWAMMLAGRALFGLGGESLQVAQNCLLFRWFKGREVALALGLNLSVARAGSVLNDVVSPWAASRWGVAATLWLGAALCVASFSCNVGSAVLDKYEGERSGIAEARSDEDFSAKEVLQLPRLYWLLAQLCVILYCGILPFNNIASAFFVDTWYRGRPQAEAMQLAGFAMSLLFMVSATGTPAFGSLIDSLGQRTHCLLCSAVLLSTTYAGIFIVRPELSMICLGGVYMIFAGALWPAFALTVPQKQLGTAYGVAVALQNSGLAVMPLVVGHLQATSGPGNFKPVITLFFCIGVVGIVIAAALHSANKTCGGVLDMPSAQAEACLASGEATPLQASSIASETFGDSLKKRNYRAAGDRIVGDIEL